MSKNPIITQTILNLRELGFVEGNFKFDVLSLEGDRYVSIKEQDGDNLTVAIIDMYNNNTVTRKPMKAEAAIMNPTQPIIALRAKLDNSYSVQVFNLENKEKLGYHQFDQKIIYWKWLSTSELVIITETHVYHWPVGSTPKLIFELTGKLLDTSTKIVGYSTDSTGKWCLVFGIYSNDQGVSIDGIIQLYSVDKRQQQLFEGYAGTFGQLRTSNQTLKKTNLLIFCEHKKNTHNIKLHLMDIGTLSNTNNSGSGNTGNPVSGNTVEILKINSLMERNEEYPNDFPISIHVLDSNGLILILTKNGFAHFYYSTTLTLLFTSRISSMPLFVSCNKRLDGRSIGALAVNRAGEVISIIVDEDNLLSSLSNLGLANLKEVSVGIATCYGLKGSDDLLLESFESFFNNEQYRQAAQIVATLKSNQLRTLDTIQRFKNKTTETGNALSHYFSVLLESGRLNEIESIELVKPVILQNRKELLKKWLENDKLTESEPLADLLAQTDPSLAFQLYTKLNLHHKAINSLIQTNQIHNIIPYITKIISVNNEFKGEFRGDLRDDLKGDKIVLNNLNINHIVESVATKQPNSLVSFVNSLISHKPGPLCDVTEITELLIRLNKLKELNEILLDYLKSNKKEHGELQTRLLEVNLKNDVRIAETILQLDILTQFNKDHISNLCEQFELYEYSLKFYTKLQDIKRVVLKGINVLSRTTLNKTLLAMGEEDVLELLRAMLENVQSELVVSSCLALYGKIDAMKLYQLLQDNPIAYQFLKSLPIIHSNTVDKDSNELVLRYISLCISKDEITELERLLLQNNNFNLSQAKELIKSSRLANPKPLMIICNRMGLVRELVEHLYNNELREYIDVFVNSINPAAVSEVIATLLDLSASEQLINKVLATVRDPLLIKSIINISEERHQLMMLKSFLESRVREGYKEEELHTALMKIYITTSQNPEQHLTDNNYYNKVVIAQYCEEIDVQLSILVYTVGGLDEQMIDLCLRHQLHKQLNQFLLKKSNLKLYQFFLQHSNVFEDLISMCIENCNSNEISVLIKFLLSENLNNYLITLLEGLLLNQTEFSNNSNLQNLLLATTIKTNPSKLSDYLSKLNNYEVNSLAKLANELHLHHCAYELYNKVNKHTEAFNELQLLLNTLGDSVNNVHTGDSVNSVDTVDNVLEEMYSYVLRVDKELLWFKLGKIYLDHDKLQESIKCYLRSNNFQHHQEIKQKLTQASEDDLLLHWLTESTKIKQLPELVNDLLIQLAKLGRAKEFTETLNNTNTDLNLVGTELIKLNLYAEAVEIYSKMNNYNKLAVCYVQLSKYTEASEAALKSKNPKILKQTFDTLLSHLTQTDSTESVDLTARQMLNRLGSELLNYPEFLVSIVSSYESMGFFDDLIELLRNTTKTVATSTELAICIAKYHPELLMEHLRNVAFESNSLNISKTARECSNLWLWKEAVFLYTIDDSDKAILSMTLHPECFEQDLFFRTLNNVSNTEVIYKALYFCIQQYPTLVPKLLLCVRSKLDTGRVIKILKNNNCIQLAKEYFQQYSDRNSQLVNDTLYELLVEECDFEQLEHDVTKYINFDYVKLCALLEEHPLSRMRDVAAKIYLRHNHYSKASVIYMKNNNYIKAIDCARYSKSVQLVHDTVSNLLLRGEMNHLLVALVVNFHLLDLPEVLEMLWLNDVNMDLIIPLIIHSQRFITHKKPLHLNNW